MSETDDKPEKTGFFKRVLGLKSKDDKRAEEAAARAAAQKRVDEDMAKRMAAINAAALKSARAHDAKALGVEEVDEDTLDAEDRAKAEAQAREAVETAKRLAAEKRAKELEVKRIAEAEAAFEKAEAERLAKEAAEKAAHAKQEAEEQAEADRLAVEAEAARKREEALVAARKKAAEDAAREAAEAEKKLAEQQAEDIRLAAELEARRAAEAERLAAEGNLLERINTGLSKSTSRMSENMAALFTKRKLDDAALQDLEDLLIGADMGVGPAMKVSAKLAADRFDKEVTDTEIKIALADVISDILTPLEKPLTVGESRPQVLLFVGVNGSGKTTTLGKLAKRLKDEGKKVLIVAGDTFRAAAVEQLSVWGERADAPVMSGKLGADAAGLVYDAIARAKAEEFDVVMIDTAGRLQNRKELMEELAKVVRVIKKQDETAPHHSILVLDATVGQNALSQTEAFKDTAGVTGLVMTKLDGTAKGGVLVALSDKFKLPIHAIGIGERIEDLEDFSAPVFAAALSGIADEMLNMDSSADTH